ncbi:hypothetical protein FJ938_23225 [Mesorhizobium sp. B2-4-14]|nr:hypothetical protein FJ938_23225 [Mesorhizobium sp. B2-4-14]
MPRQQLAAEDENQDRDEADAAAFANGSERHENARSERRTASGCNARSSGAPANAVVQETPPRPNSITLA